MDERDVFLLDKLSQPFAIVPDGEGVLAVGVEGNMGSAHLFEFLHQAPARTCHQSAPARSDNCVGHLDHRAFGPSRM